MISVTILTKNSEETIRKVLESTRSFPEVLILDTGSTDSTLTIAQEFSHVKTREIPFMGFGPLHNLASSMATYNWILSLDSDECLTPELIAEIHSLHLNPRFVYSINRNNFFNNKHIKWCGGWYPDRVIRLYHRQMTHFSNDAVHEKVLINGLEEKALLSSLNHYPYRKISDFLAKMQIYTTLFAEQNKHKEKSSLFKAIYHSWFTFFKSYLLKRGFLGGKEGYIISVYNAQTAYYKYLKLIEIQK